MERRVHDPIDLTVIVPIRSWILLDPPIEWWSLLSKILDGTDDTGSFIPVNHGSNRISLIYYAAIMLFLYIIYSIIITYAEYVQKHIIMDVAYLYVPL